MEELKNRTDIASDYKWNLNAMFLNEELYDQEVRLVVAASNRVLEYKNKIMNSSENLYQFYLDYEKFSRLQDKVYMYARLLFDSDTTNVVSQTRKMKLDKLFEQIQAKLSFISPEMLSVSYDLVLDFIKENKKLAKFTFDLEQLFKYRNHILSKEGELLLTKATNVMGTGAQVFNCLDNTDINLGTIIDENGDSVIVTNSNYSVYMKSKDRRVRKDAFNNMYTYWKSIKNTVATTLKGTIKECSFVSEVHKFDSKLKESLFADDIDISVYENLIKTVHLNVDKIDDYMILRKKILQLDSLHMYDIYVPLANSVVKNISFDSAKNIIFNALKPLGEVYLRDLEKAFSEKWIDIYPSIGKKSGAYSFGCYDSYPYLLINYENDINSVSTLAHELGHSMHSYYSNSNQDYTYHSYPIFLAEIASTVNEMLINEYLYNQAKTKEEKIFYLTEFLDKIRTTICRQTMFAEFEMIMFTKEKEGVALTETEFSNTYYNLNKQYYGDNVVMDDLIRYEWARIPHFYTPFYVYKYATGLSAAIAISKAILAGDVKVKANYLKFLASGGSDKPLNILKEVLIDMTTCKPIEDAFDMFNQKLEELKKLCDV